MSHWAILRAPDESRFKPVGHTLLLTMGLSCTDGIYTWLRSDRKRQPIHPPGGLAEPLQF